MHELVGDLDGCQRNIIANMLDVWSRTGSRGLGDSVAVCYVVLGIVLCVVLVPGILPWLAGAYWLGGRWVVGGEVKERPPKQCARAGDRGQRAHGWGLWSGTAR